YMKEWLPIYSRRRRLIRWIPHWYYQMIAWGALARIERERCCRFPHLEEALAKLGQRPVLMIHGGADTYVKPDLAHAMFDLVKGPKEFWLVDGAKHNQAFNMVNEEYQQRVLRFFQKHLAGGVAQAHAAAGAPASGEPSANGQQCSAPAAAGELIQ